jgi:hypothetical protein
LKRILAPFVSLALVAAFVTCGDDETRSSSQGQGGQGATGAQGGGGTGGDTGGMAGMGGSPNCTNDGMCTPMTEDCTCADCVDAAECGACVEDMMCTVEDACTCLDCADDGFCTSNCTDDGFCDQFNEGCVCTDCAAVPNCMGQVEDCTNGQDDNGDTLVDCDDLLYCQNNAACAEDCGNQADDNDNGLVDCEDVVYCTGSQPCVEAACATATAIQVGATMGDTTNGTASIDGSCQIPGAKEIVYTFTPASSGFVGVTLSSAADLGVHVRTACEDEMSQIACIDVGLAGDDEHGAFDATMGVPVTIIVDGFEAAESGPFTLTLALAADGQCIDDMACSAQPGEGCQCTDCVMEPVCGFCNVNQMCELDDACTCADCDADMFCTDPTNCTDDAFCDQFNEGCQCADCAAVPNCVN